MSDALIEAAVQVGAEVTRYLRCGRGGRVTLILAGSDEERAGLIAQYAPTGCVIAPVLAVPADGHTAEWLERTLERLVEGLGLEDPQVVISPQLTRRPA